MSERYKMSTSPDFRFYARSREKPEPLLTQDFALQLFDVTQHFAADLPVASLVAYADRRKFEKEIIDEIARQKSIAIDTRLGANARDRAIEAMEILKRRSIRLAVLPESPKAWRFMLDPEINPRETFTITQRQVLIKALKTTLKDPNALYTQKWLDPLVTINDLRLMEAREDQIEDPDSGVTRTMVFLSTAF